MNSPYTHLLFVFVSESFHQGRPCSPTWVSHYSPPKKHSFPFLDGGGRRGGKRKIKRSYQMNAFIRPAWSESSATLHGDLPLEHNAPQRRHRQRSGPVAKRPGGHSHPLVPPARGRTDICRGTELFPAPALGMMSAWQRYSSYGTLSWGLAHSWTLNIPW